MERTRRRQTTAAEKMAVMATDNDRSNKWSYRFVFVRGNVKCLGPSS